MDLSRFVDRDMLMRYHWSLGIGHAYSHVDNSVQPESTLAHKDHRTLLDENDDGSDEVIHPTTDYDLDENDPDPDDPELAMDERENEDLGPNPDGGDDDHIGFGEEQDGDDLFETYFMSRR